MKKEERKKLQKLFTKVKKKIDKYELKKKDYFENYFKFLQRKMGLEDVPFSVLESNELDDYFKDPVSFMIDEDMSYQYLVNWKEVYLQLKQVNKTLNIKYSIKKRKKK